MNTSFAGNQVGSAVSLDITNTYPTGLLAQLGPYYNDSQELINAQLRFTANQADITSRQDANYAIRNIELENSGTLLPTSATTVSAATVYINGANEINYANQNIATLVNTEYTNAYAIEKACRDASYSAFLTTEASQIRLDRISTLSTVMQLGNTYPYINPLHMEVPSTISTMVGRFEDRAQDGVNDASGNVQAYITNTQSLINNAIVKSSSVTANLKLLAAINTFSRTVAQAISFPLSEISGKETLVTQHIPSITLTCAIQVASKAVTFLNFLISKINGGSGDITPTITSVTNYANTLDSIARSNDLNMFFRDAVQNNLIKAASTMIGYRQIIAIPNNNPYSAYTIATDGVEAAAAAAAANARAAGALVVAAATTTTDAAIAAEAAVVAAAAAAAAISPVQARILATNADISASNARFVSNSIIDLNTAYTNTITPEPIILTSALESLSFITTMLSTVTKVTNNTSAHSGVAISKRASNTILGNLAYIIQKELKTINSAADANSILLLLNNAYSITSTITDISSIQEKLWAINAATARAKEVTEKLRSEMYLLNRTAHNLVTPQKLAVQTASANTAGAYNVNYASRLDRNSRNVPQDPPSAYNSFKAEIRAKTFIPVRPSLDELVFKNRIQPLRLDSLRTLPDVLKKVTQEVQEIKDNSRFSFRQ
uniref:Uncharacterized protein n=1 Tax=viral metagenome TaxID=1070528 RepID=A0A6C0AMD2_9ZZZZ